MIEVGIRDLKLNLSRYLARVRAGEELVVTDRGKPVARLERIEPHRPPAILEPLIASGKLIYRPPPRDLPEPIEMEPGEKTSLDFLHEQRR